MKFCTHHFPVGTVFEINESVRFGKTQTEFTVTGIYRNGARSFVLETDTLREHTGYEAYNIDHVKRIISRGTGEVKINGSRREVDYQKVLREDQQRMEIQRPVTVRRDGEEVTVFTPRKRNYNTGSMQTLLMLECHRLGMTHANSWINYQRLISQVFLQTWCTHVTQNYCQITMVNKKRLRRWLKQNINRFLTPVKAVLKAEDEEQREFYEREMEESNREYEREQGLPPGATHKNFVAGEDAFAAGTLRSANPFSEDSDDWERWDSGWQYAKRSKQAEDDGYPSHYDASYGDDYDEPLPPVEENHSPEDLLDITKEQLEATSTKTRCTRDRQAFIDMGKVMEFDSVRRHPDTCESRPFSLAEADALWATREGTLLECGMTIWSSSVLDTKYVFLTDDSCFGSEVLQRKGWGCMHFKNKCTAAGEFETWEQHVRHYYGEQAKVLESVEQLLEVLNSTDLVDAG